MLLTGPANADSETIVGGLTGYRQITYTNVNLSTVQNLSFPITEYNTVECEILDYNGGIGNRIHTDEDLVPILMYHGVQPDAPTTYSITPELFSQQMQYLHDNNYTVITFRDMIDFLGNETKLPQKSVVLTFDDGLKSQYDYAYPILLQFGYTATFAIITDMPKTNNSDYMNVSNIQEMYANGMDFQSHSVTHVDFTKLSSDRKSVV